jgi:hypothetical protein
MLMSVNAVATIVNPVKSGVLVINVLMAITMISMPRIDVMNVPRDVNFVLRIPDVTYVSKECIKKSYLMALQDVQHHAQLVNILIQLQDGVRIVHRAAPNVPQKPNARPVSTPTHSPILECAKAVMLVAQHVLITSAQFVWEGYTLISSTNVKKAVEGRCLRMMRPRDAENVLRDVPLVGH